MHEKEMMDFIATLPDTDEDFWKEFAVAP